MFVSMVQITANEKGGAAVQYMLIKIGCHSLVQRLRKPYEPEVILEESFND